MSGRGYSFWTPLFHALVNDDVSRGEDDAGTPALIRLVPGSLPFGSDERRDAFKSLDRVRVRLGNTSVRRVHIAVISVQVFCMAMILIGLSLAVGGTGFTKASALSVFPLALMIFNGWYLFAKRSYAVAGPPLRGDPDTIIRAWLAEGRCPACLYDLANLAPEPADPKDPRDPKAHVALTRCPECSHQWHLPTPP
ncbi:MAG: hypothetical protein K2X32_08305 [Phycisphaerales bacterium]|nr:hypothetical protein [Phycisphaerales bacterium]